MFLVGVHLGEAATVTFDRYEDRVVAPAVCTLALAGDAALDDTIGDELATVGESQ